MSKLTVVILSLCVVAPAGALAADGAPVEGLVVRIDPKELLINIGRDKGLRPGDTVHVLRRIDVRDPQTGKTITDRFPIGTVKLSQVGELLSIVTGFRRLKPPPRVGDFVVFHPSLVPVPGLPTARRAGKPGRVGRRSTKAKPTSGGPERTPADLERDTSFPVFKNTLGRPLQERIVIFERYLQVHPQSPHARQVRYEVDWLKAYIASMARANQRAAAAKARPTAPDRPPEPKRAELITKVAAPDTIEQDVPAEVYLVVVQHEEVTGARLLLKRKGAKDAGYTTVPMSRDGVYGWRARFGETWLERGEVEWLVEVQRKDGRAEVISGARRLKVIERHTEAVSKKNRSRASAKFDWMSFAMDKKIDQYFRFEADFRYTIDEGILTAFRIGGGMIDGYGGEVDAIRESYANVRAINATYGFFEFEFEFHTYFGVALRLSAGNNQQPAKVDRTIESIFGGGLTLRIGKLDSTRLYADIEIVEQVGQHYTLRMAIEEFDLFPMEAVIMVTDAPVGADYGVSLQYAAGFRVHDILTLYARIGWNARRVDHSGLTAGVGTVFEW